MNLTSRLARAALITVLAGAAGLSAAQGTAPSAKKDLVQKVLTLQQAGIESVGVGIANQTANQVLQVAGQAMGRVPADKREALGAELQAEVRKFFDDVAPLLRASAVKNAPSTIGTALEEKFSEDELKVLIGWLESPVSRKYQQMSPELQQGLGQKLVAETRPQIEPKLKALEQVMGAKLAAAVGAAPGASGPRAAAPRASGPVKK
ncbi:MAG: hypothetical protein A3E25_13595 [Burkholderiales bacterium RIFCSPHIGHO2_12_FULL_69_20]|nr:MAG: hypothetical protein A3E25_13595 [Burkholderiales bacterium RIFCSPHIGHO2_12_FULL_69_20]